MAIEAKKMQAPLVHEGQAFLPLTSADQIILSDGTRMRADGKAKDALALGGLDTTAYEQINDYDVKEDYGKVLTITDNGLDWAETSEGTSDVIITDDGEGNIKVTTGLTSTASLPDVEGASF